MQPIVDCSGRLLCYELFSGVARADWSDATACVAADLRTLDVIKGLHFQPKGALAVNISFLSAMTIGLEWIQALAGLMRPGWVVEVTEHGVRPEMSRRLVDFCRVLTDAGLILALDDCTHGHLYGSRQFWRDSRASIIKVNIHDPSVESLALTAKGEALSLFIENVETAADYRRALALGAAGVQGWFIGLPTPVSHQPKLRHVDFA